MKDFPRLSDMKVPAGGLCNPGLKKGYGFDAKATHKKIYGGDNPLDLKELQKKVLKDL